MKASAWCLPSRNAADNCLDDIRQDPKIPIGRRQVFSMSSMIREIILVLVAETQDILHQLERHTSPAYEVCIGDHIRRQLREKGIEIDD